MVSEDHNVKILDESGKPRDTESILEAIEVMGKVLVKPLNHDPMIVVFAPTIRDGLKELLERRSSKIDVAAAPSNETLAARFQELLKRVVEIEKREGRSEQS